MIDKSMRLDSFNYITIGVCSSIKAIIELITLPNNRTMDLYCRIENLSSNVSTSVECSSYWTFLQKAEIIE